MKRVGPVLNVSAIQTLPELEQVVEVLATSAAVRDKIAIRKAYSPAAEATRADVPLGDDCAAIPDPAGGYLLLAAEGLLESFVADDPWFAGYSAVMVNVSDVCAMGGRPIAVVNVLWSPGHEAAVPVWDGMRSAARDYAVPIVGGHTTLTRTDGSVHLAVSILGRANKLLSSFDARPGDSLLMAVDLNGAYRGDKPFWNATLSTPPERLRQIIDILPTLAESDLCRAAKDISNGGIVGTLIMLLESSRVGAVLDLNALPMPSGVVLTKWLLSFPSYGYLLSVAPERTDAVLERFTRHGLECRVIGELTGELTLELRLNGRSSTFWRDGETERGDA